jgi:hypothetical protein
VTGQVVAALVWLDDGCNPDQFQEDLQEFCQTRLAPYQRPMVVEVATGPLHGARFKKLRTPMSTGSARR